MEEKIAILQTKKGIFWMIFLGIILLTLIWILLVYNSTRIRKIDGATYPVKSLYDGYTLCLDDIKCEEDNIPLTKDVLVISGWMVKKGEDTKNVRLRIVLKNDDTGEYFMLPTTLLQRQDVTTYLDDGHNYDISGFNAKILQTALDLKNSKYMVMGLYFLNGEEWLIDFGQTVGH